MRHVLAKSFVRLASTGSSKGNPSLRFAAKIPVIVCIDIEPDEVFIDRHHIVPWTGFENTYNYFTGLRGRLESCTESAVHFSWFLRMDPQVSLTYGTATWAAEKYHDRLGKLMDKGDEIGLHTHAYRWEDTYGNWVIDHGNQPWIDECVSVSFDAFKLAFDMSCLSFRFGDGWMNSHTLNLVEDCGARFDLTLEPGRAGRPTWHPDRPYTGSLPDWTGIVQAPYRPSRENMRVSDPNGKDGIWLIPISSGATIRNNTVVPGLLSRLFGPSPQFDYPILNLNQEPIIFSYIVDRLLRAMAEPYLAFMVRSDVSIKRLDMENMTANLAFISSHAMRERFTFCTPAETLALLHEIDTDPIERDRGTEFVRAVRP